MRKIGATVGVLVAVAVVLVVTSTHAQQPSITDAATCNEAAQAKAGAGSASPAIPPTGPPSAANAPTLEPKAGTRTDPSGSIIVQSPDPLLEGMATNCLKDGAYRTAYRDCMAARLKRR